MLAAEGYLLLTEGQYPVVKLQPLAAEVLKGQHKVMQRAPLPVATPAGRASSSRSRAGSEELSAVNETIFEQLRLIRRELASREGVPSYIIFNDATLREMSVIEPQSEGDMLTIKGVGEVKYRKYGEPFLAFFQKKSMEENSTYGDEY